MQEQAFAAVEEAQAEKVVVNEGENGTEDNVRDAEADFALGGDHFCTERRIAVHVVDVVGEGGIGVVKDSAGPQAGDVAVDLYGFVNGPFFKSAMRTAEKAELGIWPETAVFHPAAEKKILALNREPDRDALACVASGERQAPFIWPIG